jgi:N-acetylglucosaminyl-diphospho-decaprenol L-rhamnosyltransferase
VSGGSHANVSLIVVNYNGAELLPACLESALASLPPGGEVLVVDNASTDDSRAVLARYGNRVRLVPSPKNLGFGRACNLGAAAARGDLLVFANPDVSFPPGWAEPLVQAASSDQRLGLLCPQTIAPGAASPDTGGPQVEEHGMIPGCCLTARRDAWLALGGFDEAFFMYWEDTELCWRAWLLGWRVGTARRSWVYHQKGATTGAFGRWDAERTRNSLYTHLKLMRWPVVLGYAARLLVVCAAKAVLRPSLAPGLARAWAWNLAHLEATLRRRRQIQARRVGDPRLLERRISAMERRLRAARARRQARVL